MVSPAHGPCGTGTPVIVIGSGFVARSARALPTVVAFGGVPASAVTALDDARLTCVAPPGAPMTTVDVSVANGNGDAPVLASAFTYLAPTLADSCDGPTLTAGLEDADGEFIFSSGVLRRPTPDPFADRYRHHLIRTTRADLALQDFTFQVTINTVQWFYATPIDVGFGLGETVPGGGPTGSIHMVIYDPDAGQHVDVVVVGPGANGGQANTPTPARTGPRCASSDGGSRSRSTSTRAVRSSPT